MPCKIKLVIQEVSRLEDDDGITYIDDPIVVESGTWSENHKDILETIEAIAKIAVNKLLRQYAGQP